MTCDYISLANKGVQSLSPYQPGKPIEELERELGISHIVKLASNENPLGLGEKVQQAIQASLTDIARYPDGNGFTLKEALAVHLSSASQNTLPLNISLDNITLGNGSNDVLELIARAYLSVGDEVIFSEYTFAVYPIVTQAIGATAVVTKAKEWGHDLEAMANAITAKTKLIFIANPNNPTGTSFGVTEWQSFIQQVPENVIVVLDEAYFEYVSRGLGTGGLDADRLDGTAYLKQYKNLVITRTFSKAYGLASLRVGYSVSDSSIANVLNRVRQPFNVNSMALVAATSALSDGDYLERSRQVNREGMQQLTQGFAQLGLEFISSSGNFVTVNFKKEAMPIFESLLKQGVIVRPVANYGMPTFLRVSIGLAEENAKFLKALSAVLANGR